MALTDKLTAIADAIRAKDGTTGTMTLAEMPEKIADIQTGGGGGGPSTSGFQSGSFIGDGGASISINIEGDVTSVLIFSDSFANKTFAEDKGRSITVETYDLINTYYYLCNGFWGRVAVSYSSSNPAWAKVYTNVPTASYYSQAKLADGVFSATLTYINDETPKKTIAGELYRWIAW